MSFLALLGLAVLAVLVLLFFISFFVFMGLPLGFSGAPFIPSYRRKNKNASAHLKNIIDFCKTEMPNGRFVDLGSGDGRVVIEFARAGFESMGVEMNPFLVWWSRIKIKNEKLKFKNAKIIRSNFWKIGFQDYDIVYIFQLSSINLLITKKLQTELQPGAIIISFGFPFMDFDLIKKQGEFLVYKV